MGLGERQSTWLANTGSSKQRPAAKFGVDVSEAQRLKALEEKNTKLKKLLVERMPDVVTFRELFSNNDSIAARRSAVVHLHAIASLPERPACSSARIGR